MIGYTLLGTNDLEKSKAFYDALFAKVGAKSVVQTDRIYLYSNGEGPMFGICTPVDGEPASNGNGTMIAIPMPDTASIDAIHEHALSIGAEHVFGPAEGGNPGFYGAYVRDFDGNKLCFYNIAQ